MINDVRCEYEAWGLITDMFLYEETKKACYLLSAKERFNKLVQFTNLEGGLKFGTSNDKVWVGENGLASWGSLRLYKQTGDSNVLFEAKRWVNYAIKHPPTVNEDEPRLYPVFLTWINYALMEMASLNEEGWQGWKKLSEEYTTKLISLQKRKGKWSICYHYDLYCARGLLYAYKFFTTQHNGHYQFENVHLAEWCYSALNGFMKVTRHSKIPLLNVRPIHYLFFDWKGSGYSTLQYAQLRFEMYLTFFNIDDYLEGKVSLEACKKHLIGKDGLVVKRQGDKIGNLLASDWFKYVEFLEEKCRKITKEWL
jgi:hypothetical protein